MEDNKWVTEQRTFLDVIELNSSLPTTNSVYDKIIL